MRHSNRDPWRAGRCAGRRRQGLERHRAGRDAPAPADRPRPDPWDRDGPRRGLRRGQRDRPRPSAVPRRPRRRRGPAVGVAGCGRRDGGSPRAQGDHACCPPCWARHGLHRHVVGDPGRADRAGRRRCRRGRRRRDDRRADGRRVHGGLHADHRNRRRRLAADRLAGHSGVRPRRLRREHEAVPDQEPFAVPLEGAVRADEQGLRKGVQRGQGARGAEQLQAYGRPDGRCGLLAVRPDRALEPAHAGSRRSVRPRHGRPGPPLRDGQPRCEQTVRSPAGTTSTTGASGGRGRRSARRTPTATRGRSPTRAGRRSSRRRRQRPRRSVRRRSRTTRRATAV